MEKKGLIKNMVSRFMVMVVMISLVSGMVFGAPSINVVTPVADDYWAGTQTITWTSSEMLASYEFFVWVRLNDSAGTEYAVDVTGLGFESTEAEWDTTTFVDGRYNVRVGAYEGGSNFITEAFSGVMFVDNTPPSVISITTLDTDGDGNVDTASIVFDESIDDSTFDAADFSIGGSPGTEFSGTSDDSTLDVTVSGVTGTDVKDVTYTKNLGAGADLAGALVTDIATGDITEVDSAAPVITVASTIDADADGSIDGYAITFSENVDDGTLNIGLLSIGSETNPVYVTGTGDDSSATITFDDGTSDTATTPDITTSGAGLIDDFATTPVSMVQIAADTITETDGAAPALLTAVASDNTNDIDGIDSDDTVVLTFSEAISDPSITNLNIDTILGLGGSSWLDDSSAIGSAVWSSDTITVTLNDFSGSLPDVAVGDTITPTSVITDGTNAMGGDTATISGNFDDITAPEISSASTVDADGDGDIDGYLLTFDEGIDDSTFDDTNLAIAGQSTFAFDTGNTPDDSTGTITFTDGVSNSGVIPDLTTSAAGLFDDLASIGGPNEMLTVGTGAITETDGAAPVITAASTVDADADGTIDGYDITFSEDVDDSSVDLNVLSIGSETNPVYVTGTDDDSSATITFDDGTSDTAATPDITTSGAGLIDDLATTPNEMAQIATGDITETDGAAPALLSAITGDSQTGDSTATTKVLAIFSEDLDATTIATADILVDNVEPDTESEVAAGVVELTMGSALSTSDTPIISISNNGMEDNTPAGNTITSGSVTASDGLSPSLTSATFTDINTLTVVLSEAVTAVEGDFTSITSDTGGNTADSLTGSGTTTIIITLGTTLTATDDTGTFDIGAGIYDSSDNNYAASVGDTIADGVAPTFSVTYDKTSPVPAGTLQITVVASETLGAEPTLSLDQQGSTDVADVATTCGSPFTSCTYDYTVMTANGGTYIDGSASVTVSGADDDANAATDVTPTSGDTFTIDTTLPVVDVTYPDGGEFFNDTSVETITWTASDTNLDANSINLSYYDGSVWVIIATSEANDGSYDWTVPSLDISTALIRVTAEDDAGNTGTSDSAATFTIDSTDPAVSVVEPNGDEVLKGGNDFLIEWTVSDTNLETTPITIEYYDGASWQSVASGLTGTSYTWTVPNEDLLNALIRVSAIDKAGNSGSDDSDADFTIDSTAPSISSEAVVTSSKVGDAIPINATIVDLISGLNVTEIYLNYFDGTTLTSLTMANATDAASRFNATIPAPADNGTIVYNLSAKDIAGNEQITTTYSITVKDFVLSLSAGWNLVSVPKTLNDATKTIVFDDDKTWYYDIGVSDWDEPTTINPGYGYWVNSSEMDLSLNYAVAEGQGWVPPSITIQDGWNLMGHMCPTAQDIDEMTSLYDDAKYIYNYGANGFGFCSKDPVGGTWSCDSNYYSNHAVAGERLEPGKGYWISFKEEAGDTYTHGCSEQ